MYIGEKQLKATMDHQKDVAKQGLMEELMAKLKEDLMKRSKHIAVKEGAVVSMVKGEGEVKEEGAKVEEVILEEKVVKKKSYANTQMLKRHVHQKEKPFACKETGCSKTFRGKHLINRHIKTVHLHLRPFPVCPILQTGSFLSRDGL